MSFLTNLILWFKGLPRFAVKAIAWGALAVLLIYYPLGMLYVHKVDDSSGFAPPVAEGQSAAVAVAAGVIDREVSRHWAPNDPFFYPGWALTRMPAFQKGIISGVARFTLSLSDQLARTRGSSKADADLQKAVGLFNYPPTVWLYDPSISLFLPTASSEAQYGTGVKLLYAYNDRLSRNEAVFERRADNLLDTLERFAADLGSASGATEEFIHDRSVFSVLDAGRLYYENKGKMYVYYLLMRALEQDFAQVIAERQLGTAWAQTLKSLQEGAELDTLITLNADPDNQILPSHLAAQGFYLMRARTQLREVTDILLK